MQEFQKAEHFKTCTREIFGPFQVIVEYQDQDLNVILDCLERMSAHLTAAVVSKDVLFQQKVLAHTVNGTTYCGIRGKKSICALYCV